MDNNWIVESGLDKNDDIVIAGIQNINSDGQTLKIISQQEYEKDLNAGK